MHHSFEKRLIVVESYQAGKSLSWIKLHLGVDEKQVRDWAELFRLYGKNGLRHGHSNILSGAEKERIVRLAIEKGVGHQELYVHNRISRSALEAWIRTVRSHGYSALYECKPKGRPKMTKVKKRPQKLNLKSCRKKTFVSELRTHY